MNIRLALITALTLGLCIASFARATSVPAYQGNVAHDGNVILKGGFVPNLKKKWERDLGGPVSYPLVVNDLVFVTVGNANGEGSQIIALDLHTGADVWRKQIIDRHSNRSGATYDNGRIFVVDALGAVQAISADRTGKVFWTTQLTGQQYFMGAPTAHAGQIVEAGAFNAGTLYSINETNGAVSWTAFVQNGSDGSPAFGDNGVYVTYPCQYYKFNPTNGDLLWNYDDGCEGGGGWTPVYHDDRLYVRWPVNARDSIMDTESGAKVGTFNVAVPSPAIFHSAANGDYFVELDYFGNLDCFNLTTGAAVWSFSGDGWLASAPLVVNGIVVEGTQLGNLYLIDGESGAPLWSENVGSPIAPPDELDDNGPLTGFAAVKDALLIPATNSLIAYKQEKK